MIRNAFEVLIENGYQPEIAYFECLHELKLIVDLIQRYGISGMYRGVSETARFGGLTVGGNVINQETKQRMREALHDIQSGAFADRWVSAYRTEKARAFDKYMEELEAHPIEQVGRRLRQMMWPDDVKTGRVKSWSKLSKKTAPPRKIAKPAKKAAGKKRKR
jgi:ketol-acid reductoisomerase